MTTPKSQSARLKIRFLTGVLLLAWALGGFGWVWFARALDFTVGDWTFNFWMAAQGSLLLFLGITILNAWYFNRLDKKASEAEEQASNTAH